MSRRWRCVLVHPARTCVSHVERRVTAWRGVSAALGLLLAAIPAHSQGLGQSLAARDWVARSTMSRFSAYAEVCKPHMPGMTGAWERALANIRAAVERVAAQQLATSQFTGLDKESLPAARSVELRRGVDKAQGTLTAWLENQDPDGACPKFLRSAQGFDDESIRPIVIDALVGFRAMLGHEQDGHSP